MSNGHFTLLTDRTVLRLSGADVRSFLQGIVTANINKLAADRALYSGLLMPQGKILFDFFLACHGDEIWVDCAADLGAELKKRLTFYKLRAAVEIEEMGDALAVAAAWDVTGGLDLHEAGAAKMLVGGVAFADPRVADAGIRVIAPAERIAELTAENGLVEASEDDYHARRIGLGLADSTRDIGSGEHFPHECNFDQFGGIDLKKGCYVGQEVVSRTEHRSTARKRFVPLQSTTAPLSSGANITGNGKTVGQITSSALGNALALVRLDRAQSALDAEAGLEADGQTVALRKPGWARFDVPGTGA